MVTEYTRPVRWMPACGLVGEKRCSGRVGSRAAPGSGGETLPTHYPSSAVSHHQKGAWVHLRPAPDLSRS